MVQCPIQRQRWSCRIVVVVVHRRGAHNALCGLKCYDQQPVLALLPRTAVQPHKELLQSSERHFDSRVVSELREALVHLSRQPCGTGRDS